MTNNKDIAQDQGTPLKWTYFSWKDILAAGLTILLLTLSYPDADMGHFAWIALLPWLVLIGTRESPPVVASFLIGAVFFIYNSSWLGYVTYPGWLGLSLYQTMYFVAFAVACSFVYRTLRIPLFLFAPFLWVAQEYLRSFVLSGFPWFFLAHTQYSYLSIIQMSDITGAYGVSFIVVIINACFADGILRWLGGKQPHMPVTLAFAISLVPLSYGMFSLAGLQIEEGPRLSLIQGNIPMSLKMDRSLRQNVENLNKYLELSRQIEPAGVDLVVWPETSIPGLLNIDPGLFGREIDRLSQSSISKLAKELHTNLLIGGISLDPDSAAKEDKVFYNSAFFYKPDGTLTERYDKLHLVPFGEYTPLKDYFPFLRRMVPYQTGLTPGTDWHLFNLECQDLRKFRFATLICYEDTIPQVVRRFKRLGADFMINITNDGWFGDSAELDQHLAIMVLRAVENRVGIVRAANTGISAFVAPTGDVYTLLHNEGKRREVEGVLEANVLLSPGESWYTAHGDIFAQICLAITVGLLLGPTLRRYSQAPEKGQ